MPIKMVLEKEDDMPDIHYPAFFCDVCGERIYKYGNVLIPSALFTEEDTPPQVPLFCHKECNRKVDNRYWMELTHFVAYLKTNLDRISKRGDWYEEE